MGSGAEAWTFAGNLCLARGGGGGEQHGLMPLGFSAAKLYLHGQLRQVTWHAWQTAPSAAWAGARHFTTTWQLTRACCQLCLCALFSGLTLYPAFLLFKTPLEAAPPCLFHTACSTTSKTAAGTLLPRRPLRTLGARGHLRAARAAHTALTLPASALHTPGTPPQPPHHSLLPPSLLPRSALPLQFWHTHLAAPAAHRHGTLLPLQPPHCTFLPHALFCWVCRARSLTISTAARMAHFCLLLLAVPFLTLLPPLRASAPPHRFLLVQRRAFDTRCTYRRRAPSVRATRRAFAEHLPPYALSTCHLYCVVCAPHWFRSSALLHASHACLPAARWRCFVDAAAAASATIACLPPALAAFCLAAAALYRTMPHCAAFLAPSAFLPLPRRPSLTWTTARDKWGKGGTKRWTWCLNMATW